MSRKLWISCQQPDGVFAAFFLLRNITGVEEISRFLRVRSVGVYEKNTNINDGRIDSVGVWLSWEFMGTPRMPPPSSFKVGQW